MLHLLLKSTGENLHSMIQGTCLYSVTERLHMGMLWRRCFNRLNQSLALANIKRHMPNRRFMLRKTPVKTCSDYSMICKSLRINRQRLKSSSCKMVTHNIIQSGSASESHVRLCALNGCLAAC